MNKVLSSFSLWKRVSRVKRRRDSNHDDDNNNDNMDEAEKPYFSAKFNGTTLKKPESSFYFEL